MYNGRHEFLRRDRAVLNINNYALDRIISRGLGRVIQKENDAKPILPLVNSEAHILCSDVDVTATSVAYGRWAIPNLKKQLLSTDVLVARKAVSSLLDMVHDPERAVEAIRMQVIPRLAQLIVSKDLFLRQHVLQVLRVLGLQPGGKLAIIHHRVIMFNLSTLLRDPDHPIRLSAARTVLALATWYLGVQELINQYFICTVIHQLNAELDVEIMVVLLEILALLLDQNMDAKLQGLNNEGIELAVLLQHPDADVRAEAAAVISQLTRHPVGKSQVLAHKPYILATLTHLLVDPEMKVRTHAASALMFLLCKTEAKLHCLHLPAPVTLTHCALPLSPPVLQLNAIKALTSLADAPAGKLFLQTNIGLVQDIQTPNALVQRHKDILLTVINTVV